MIWSYFYPRSPCGERQPEWVALIEIKEFLSTLSLRRATKLAPFRYYFDVISIHALLAESDARYKATPPALLISIHALLAESDSKRSTIPRYLWNFYPRSPCGERRQAHQRVRPGSCISIHALLAESDSPFK